MLGAALAAACILPGLAGAQSSLQPPTGVTVTAGDTELTLRWAAVTGADHYDIYRQNPDGTWPTKYGAASTLSYRITGLTNGTTYTFRITSADKANNQSAPSSPVSGAPKDLPPPMPTGLAGTAGDTTATLHWTAVSAADLAGYRVYRRINLGQVPTAITLTGPATTYTDTGLTDGTTYTYYVTAYDKGGNESNKSATVTVTPVDRTPPAPPAGLQGLAGDTTATLSWAANTEPDFDHYAIYRANPGGWPSTPLATQTATAFTDTALTDGVRYDYRVTAVDASGNESAPATVSITPVDRTPPAAPANVAAQGSESAVTVRWDPNAESDLAQYALYRQNPDGTWPAAPLATTAATSLTDFGLTDGTPYSYRVTALDTAGNESAPSAVVTATAVDLTAPAAPTGLTGSAANGSAGLQWGANQESDLAGYRVYRQDVPGAIPVVMSTTQTALVDSPLTNGQSYSYWVTAVDTNGNESALSATLVLTPQDTIAPATPPNLAATPADATVALQWDPVTDADLDHYAIYRRNPDGSWPSSPLATSTTPAFSDTGLYGVPYTYRVAAVDAAGNESPPSAPVTATPLDTTPPAAPAAPAIVPADGSLELDWTASPEPDVVRYGIYRQNPDGTWPTTPTATSSGTSFTDSGLTDGTAYTYEITAFDAAGNESQPSGTVTGTPVNTIPPAAPTGLHTYSGEGQIVINWTASPEPDFSHYAIYRQNPDGTWPTTPTDTSPTPTFTDSGLIDYTDYTYEVTAIDTAGNESVPSAPITDHPRDLTPPATPTNLQVAPGDTRVDLSWDPSTDSDFNHFAIYRQNPDGTWPSTPTQTQTGTLWTDTNVYGNVSYTYEVTAVDVHNNASSPAGPGTATPWDHTPPAVPPAPFPNPGNNQIAFSWTESPDKDIDHYNVYRQNSDGSWPATPTARTNPDLYVATGLSNGQSSTWRVTAVDQLGNESAPSQPTTSAPSGRPPIVDPGPMLNTSPNSLWSQPIPSNAQVDPSSSVMMRGVDTNGNAIAGAQGGLQASITKNRAAMAYLWYTSPIYVVGPNQPKVSFHITDPTASPHVALEQAVSSGVPVPAYAQSSAGTDGHITIYQPSSDTLWEFWHACSPLGPNTSQPSQSAQKCPTTPARTWTADFGGVMTNVSQSKGYFDTSSFPGLSDYWWGATATSLPISAGMITMADLQKGSIDHALAFDIPSFANPGAACAYKNWKNANGVGVTPMAYPAQRSDGTYSGPDCIPEGALLRLDPTLDLSTLGLPKITLMIAKAAQKYGMIVRDRVAGGVQFFAEDPLSLRQQGETINPYTGLSWTSTASPLPSGLLYGQPTWNMFAKFPWDKVDVMQMTICHHLLLACGPAGN